MVVQGVSIEKYCLNASGTAITTVISHCHRLSKVKISFIYGHSVYLWSNFLPPVIGCIFQRRLQQYLLSDILFCKVNLTPPSADVKSNLGWPHDSLLTNRMWWKWHCITSMTRPAKPCLLSVLPKPSSKESQPPCEKFNYPKTTMLGYNEYIL